MQYDKVLMFLALTGLSIVALPHGPNLNSPVLSQHAEDAKIHTAFVNPFALAQNPLLDKSETMGNCATAVVLNTLDTAQIEAPVSLTDGTARCGHNAPAVQGFLNPVAATRALMVRVNAM